MRQVKNLMLLVMMVSFVSVMSCSSDDDNAAAPPLPPPAAQGPEHLTAKIDGVDFAAAQSPAVIVGAQNTNGVLAVQGGTNTGDTINFVIQGYTGVGTYVVADNMNNNSMAQFLRITPAVEGWVANGIVALGGQINPGTIEITSDDGVTVMGTFSFEGFNGTDSSVKVITDGDFQAVYDN